jgi:REP element-mobilizing transposase RayT
MTAFWDDNEFPLAYFITFRTYGTWLHGDGRGSIDRYHNKFRGPRVPGNRIMEDQHAAKLKSSPVMLDAKKRAVIRTAIEMVCRQRGWKLVAINIRTNHIHLVISAMETPDRIVRDLKAYSTRAMKAAKLWSYKHSPWVDGSSKRYLWKESSVANACDYVINRQGEDLPEKF